MYKYLANQFQILLAYGQNCIAFRYAILNKIFHDSTFEIPNVPALVDPVITPAMYTYLQFDV